MAVTKKTTTAAPAEAKPVVAEKKAPAPKAAPAPKPVAVEPVAAAAPVAAAPEATTPSALEDVLSKVGSLATLLKETQTALRVLAKEYDRMKKLVEKTERKRANARSNPNGFAKPSKITDELCDFLGVAKGTEMSRTDVTRKVNAYIKEHNLNKPENRRIILPDAKLRKILAVKADEEVSYFSLQKYLSRCFVKA